MTFTPIFEDLRISNTSQDGECASIHQSLPQARRHWNIPILEFCWPHTNAQAASYLRPPSTQHHIHSYLLFENLKLTFQKSDAEDNASNAPDVAEADEVEVSGDAASKGQMSVLDALKGVLKLALMHDGLARGLREASKALDRRQAHMCVLNEACEEEAYKKLVVALCSEHKIPLIKVPDGKQLGEWAGLCKYSMRGYVWTELILFDRCVGP